MCDLTSHINQFHYELFGQVYLSLVYQPMIFITTKVDTFLPGLITCFGAGYVFDYSSHTGPIICEQCDESLMH